MSIPNNKEEIPFSHYAAAFAAADPQEIAARLGVRWENHEFYVNLLGKEYAISHPDARFRGELPLPAKTFLLRWLLEGKNIPWHGGWKTFREMPWGELYIVPFTGRALTRAAFTFGTRVEAYRAAAQKLGGEAVTHGDAGFAFELLPGLRLQLLVWAGDEEFPPSAQILYSDNFAEAIAPEDRVVAADILIGTVKAAM